MLVFRDQPMDDDKQIEFSENFGPLETTLSANPAARQPHLPRLSSVDLDYTQDMALYFRAAFLMLVIIALLFGTLPYLLPILYLEASLFTYWLYQADKNAAVARQTQRLPEESLQMFSLIGGWPGALVAQKRLHHKVHKMPFQREFRFVIYGNSCFLLWLLSDSGTDFLHKIALF